MVSPFPMDLVIPYLYELNTLTGMVVFSSTVQGAVPGHVRGQVFTLFYVSWNATRLLSLAIGTVMVDAIGIRHCSGPVVPSWALLAFSA